MDLSWKNNADNCNWITIKILKNNKIKKYWPELSTCHALSHVTVSQKKLNKGADMSIAMQLSQIGSYKMPLTILISFRVA